MRNVLYPKLAATNIKKNGKTYFPYLLTCILTVMMFYDLLLVSTNSALDTMPGASQLRLILNFAVTITGGFSAIFLFYTNSFLVRQRKKEMGLYQVLGMDKTNLTKMMVWESIYCGRRYPWRNPGRNRIRTAHLSGTPEIDPV